MLTKTQREQLQSACDEWKTNGMGRFGDEVAIGDIFRILLDETPDEEPGVIPAETPDEEADEGRVRTMYDTGVRDGRLATLGAVRWVVEQLTRDVAMVWIDAEISRWRSSDDDNPDLHS